MRTGVLASIAAALLATALPSLGRPAPPGADLAPDAAVLVDALHRVRIPDPPPLQPLAVELSSSVEAELELVFTMLATRRVPAHAGVEVQVLSETQAALLLEILAQVPGARVRERALQGLQRSWTEPEAASANLRVLGAVGHAAELETVLSLAAQSGLAERSRLSAFEACLAGMLRREAACLRLLELRWRDLSDGFLAAAIEAVSAADRPEGLFLLSELLEARPDLAPRLLPRIRTLARAPSRSIAECAAVVLSPYLRSEDTTLLASACFALAGLEDTAATPDLLDLLDAESPVVRDAAHFALRELGRVDLPPQLRLWREWYAAEVRWAASELPGLLQQLDSARPDRSARALAELVRHPLQRHVVARAAAPLLKREVRWLQILVTNTLGELGSTEAVPELLLLLEHGQSDLRDAARSALVAITGDRGFDGLAAGHLAGAESPR